MPYTMFDAVGCWPCRAPHQPQPSRMHADFARVALTPHSVVSSDAPLKLDAARHRRWWRMASSSRKPGTRRYSRFGEVLILPNGKRVRTQVRFVPSTVLPPVASIAIGPRHESVRMPYRAPQPVTLRRVRAARIIL